MTPDGRASVRSVGFGLVLTALVAAGLGAAALRAPVTPVRTTAGRSLAHPPVSVRATTTQPAGDGQALVARGYQVFQQSCVRCHGANGEGGRACCCDLVPLVGTGLTRWQVRAAVHQGIPPGMPAFDGRLLDAEIRAVAAYVQRLGAGQPAE
jgi:cytochrome c oxidase cbb3-type subunit 3